MPIEPTKLAGNTTNPQTSPSSNHDAWVSATLDARNQNQHKIKVTALMSAANIPLRYACPPRRDNAKWNTKFYAIEKRLGTGVLIGLLGNRGEGKTMLATELIKSACNQEHSGLYTTAMDIFISIKSSYRENSSEQKILRPFKDSWILVIDEAQERGETPWEDRMLTYIIDNRYANRLDTIIISNQTPAQFARSMGSSIVSRMRESGGIVECDWPSFR